MYSSAVFTGDRPLCTQILPGQSRPHQQFLASENSKHWLPEGVDRIPLRSLVLTQYKSATDRQTGGYAVPYTVLAKLALRRHVKTSSPLHSVGTDW